MKCKLKNLIISGILALMPFINLYSQGLRTGQRCPDVMLKYIFNYKTSEVKLSDLKKKLVILDFWGLHCTGCIEAFPKMDSLQQIFDDKIQIIMVNKEGEIETEKFLTKLKNIKIPNLPFVTGDSTLSKLFPHLLVPHHVWLDSNRIVDFITNGWNTTEDNIRLFLAGKDLKLPEKKDVLHFDWDRPFITLVDSNLQKQVEYYSYIMHAVQGLSGSYSIDAKGGSLTPNHISFNRAPAIRLFITAFEEGGKYDFKPRNSVVLKVKDSAEYIPPEDVNDFDKWIDKYSYCYELKVPPLRASKLYTFMQQDLERYFDVEAKIAKNEARCLVINKINSKNIIKTKGGRTETYQKDGLWYFHNVPFKDFILNLKVVANGNQYPNPIIDNSGIKGNVDMAIDASLIKNFNVVSLIKCLRKYGLNAKERDWVTDVLIIRDKK